MIVELYIYIDDVARRIELFDDEKISVTSSIQNINDISKVFTDYSQSFTIPASANNNEIFKYWYESGIDNGFNQGLRYNGFIKIDTQTFRVGKWQLESATIKENRVEDYKITFYGDLKSLTDKFGEDKLKDIETLNEYSLNYTGANIQTSITTNLDFDIHYPLISSSRAWQSGGGGANDITNVATPIHFSELFPAIKLKRVFDAIESKYGVTFTGDFLNQSRFTQAYLWLKNSEQRTLLQKNEKQLITLIDESGNDFFLIENDTLKVLTFTAPDVTDVRFKLTITFTGATNSTLYVYKGGNLYTTINGSGTSLIFNVTQNLLPGDYQFYLQTQLPASYTADQLGTYFDMNTSTTVTLFNNTTSDTTFTNLDLTSYAPDIKVSDFFSGVLKMFNLTAFSTDGINFTLEQLENWYYLGKIKDFSQYTLTDLEFQRIKAYKKIDFKYEKSESLLNRTFFNNNNREYGDLIASFDNDGGEYSIKLPFEDIMFNKFTGTNLQVAYALKPDLNPYAPKPIIIYKYERTTCSFRFNNGTTTDLISNYNVFGQDVKYQGGNHSLNWGIEISSYLLQAIDNSLFGDYYSRFLLNLYSLKSRMVKVKMRLPYTELINLKLNDRIVIRNKRYIINQFTTDLTTFESDFELVQDFRDKFYDNSQVRTVSNTSHLLSFDIVSIGELTWTIDSDPDGIINSATQTGSVLEVSVQANGSGLERIAVLKSNLNDTITIVQDA
jgi:hypothetical protein